MSDELAFSQPLDFEVNKLLLGGLLGGGGQGPASCLTTLEIKYQNDE